MRVGQVGYVDVVAQTGAVRGRVVLSVDLHSGSGLCRRNRARNDMNLWIVIFAELAVGIRAGRVEIPQPDRPDAVCALEVRQCPLHRQLRLAVAVDRRRRIDTGRRLRRER